MKSLYVLFIAVFLMFNSSSGLEASSERIRVSLNVDTTEIVRADLRVDDHYYYIDTNACICWVARLIGGNNSIATVDCEKLFAHERLRKYLSNCVDISHITVEEPSEEEPSKIHYFEDEEDE